MLLPGTEQARSCLFAVTAALRFVGHSSLFLREHVLFSRYDWENSFILRPGTVFSEGFSLYRGGQPIMSQKSGSEAMEERANGPSGHVSENIRAFRSRGI